MNLDLMATVFSATVGAGRAHRAPPAIPLAGLSSERDGGSRNPGIKHRRKQILRLPHVPAATDLFGGCASQTPASHLLLFINFNATFPKLAIWQKYSTAQTALFPALSLLDCLPSPLQKEKRAEENYC